MRKVDSTFRTSPFSEFRGLGFSVLQVQLSLVLGRERKGIPIHIYRTRIHTYVHTTRALCIFRSRVQPSVKFLFSSRDIPICVYDSANFLNDPLKHFSLSLSFCLSSSPSRASLFRIFNCLRSPCSFSFTGETSSKNATTYYGLFSPSLLLSAHFEESFCISNSNSCKDSTCPTAAWSFFDAARTVPMTFLIKLFLLLSTGTRSPQRIWANPKRFVNCD